MTIEQLLDYLRGTSAAPVPPPAVPLCERCGVEPAIDDEGVAVGRACIYRGAAIAARPASFTTAELAEIWAGREDVVELANVGRDHYDKRGRLCRHRTLGWRWVAPWPKDDTTVTDEELESSRRTAIARALAGRPPSADHADHHGSIAGCADCANESFERRRS